MKLEFFMLSLVWDQFRFHSMIHNDSGIAILYHEYGEIWFEHFDRYYYYPIIIVGLWDFIILLMGLFIIIIAIDVY